MAHVAILRSPYAHARIKGIDTTKARGPPGVVAVYTGKDFEHLNPLPCAWQAGGTENFVATPRALEIDRVTFTGAGVAAVVAETRDRRGGRARADRGRLGAARRRSSTWSSAVEEGAPQLHEVAERTSSWTGTAATRTATEQALDEADVVVEQRLVNQRLIPTPIEARGAAATVRAGDRRLHGLDDVAGPARHAAADDGVRVRHPRDEDARDRAAGRRRLRVEDLPLPRVRARGARSPRRPAGR